jgi:predicted metal-binding membrane protein
MTSWRDGRAGAFRMGIEHGLYCAGCSWLLFVILFPLGMFNIAALALVTVLIFAEKSLPHGRHIAALAGAVMIAFGVLAVIMPQALPTTM